MKVKLCGLFRDCDVDYANEAMPDYVGFVFAQSKRRIDAKKAEEFRKRLSGKIKAVGVFVDEDLEVIQDLVNKKIIDLIQLHGNESEEYIRILKNTTTVPIIKAIRVRNPEQVTKAESLSCDYLLLDAYAPGVMGGIGKEFDWTMIPPLEKPFFLAGGLKLDNIEEALKQKAFALDLSSGIETDGVKNKQKMIQIVQKIRNNG